MSFAQEILASPLWLPQQIEPAGKRILFARFEDHQFRNHDFLANQSGVQEHWVAVDDLYAAPVRKGPVHFIFHSGFCRSTLLLRALQVEGRVRTLNEPEIINSLARLPDPDTALVGLIVDLLSRPHEEGETVLVKPSNFPNRLIPAIMAARSDTRAIFMTNTLDEFLWAIVRKGLLGRQWGRQAYLVASEYAGETRAFADHIAGMTDLQVAGLGWLITQHWFAACRKGLEAPRTAGLLSARFDRERGATIAAVAAHFGLGLQEGDIAAIVAGQVFAADAKTGADYAAKEAQDTDRSFSAVTAEEIRDVSSWIEELARVSGIALPPRTLPG